MSPEAFKRLYGGSTGKTKRIYEAYCFYLPTGMGEDFEKPLLDKLKEFGTRKGNLVLTAQWNPGLESYNEVIRELHCKVPTVIFSNSSKPTAGTFNVIVDRIDLIKDVQSMITEIPQLCQLIIDKNYSKATKECLKAQREEDFKRLVKGISSALKHVTITASMAGASINANL
jgi:hypothetical protein